MATKKETVVTNKFTKGQLVQSNRYIRYSDFLEGNLEENKTYSFEEVEKLISSNYKKGGK